MTDRQTGGTRAPALEAADLEKLRAAVRGPVIEPGDPGYDAARQVYNAMIDRRPRLIVQCADVADVMAGVDFAREQGLLLAIRGGGHNVAGMGTVDGGMVLDLSPMKGVRVDPEARTVRAEGGCTWGDVDHATHPFGLATPSGFISTTGVAGLSLGGGIGYLTRHYGLTCDNLISADVVTADGHLVKASAEEHPDLFWALRGGSGNFGVVTSFQFQLHPVDTVFAGPVFYPIEKTREAMRFYRDFMAQAPEELNAFFGFQIGPPAPFIPEHLQMVPMAIIVACYSGPMEQAEDAVRPIREFGPPALDLMSPIPFPALQSMFDPMLPKGLYHYWKTDFFDGLSDEAIEVHARYGPQVPTVQATMHMYAVDGAAQRVGNGDTAYWHREAQFSVNIASMWPEQGDTERCMTWARDYWNALHPYSSGGGYVNFLTDDGQERLRETYRDNYPRLVDVKNRYDPGNLFRVNWNIQPTV